MQSMAWREDKFLFGLLLFDMLLVSEIKMIFIKLFSSEKEGLFLRNATQVSMLIFIWQIFKKEENTVSCFISSSQ